MPDSFNLEAIDMLFKASASTDHFFCIWTFMNCGAA